MTKRFCYLILFSALLLLTACSPKPGSDRLDDYPLSEIESAIPCVYPSTAHAAIHALPPYILRSDALHVCLSYSYYYELETVDWEYGYILEKWDGNRWHTLCHYGLEEISGSGEAPDLEKISNSEEMPDSGSMTDILQHSAEGAAFEADFEQAFATYGTGLYRVIRKCSTASDHDEPFYCARNVRLIDINDFKSGITFQALFQTEETPADITLTQGNETLALSEADAETIFHFISQMHCVATGTNSSQTGLGANDHNYHVSFILDDGTLFTITPFSGKTLDGKDYSAICQASGMAEAVFLYDRDMDLLELIP